jgi:lysophospholipase L1-like esterase
MYKSYFSRRFFQNAALLCAAILFFLLAAEGALRVFFSQSLLVYKRFPEGEFCRPHRLYGWTGIPNESGTWSHTAKDMEDMPVSMNDKGFFDRDHSVVKPSGTTRLLFLGDSFTIGFGLPKEARFADLIMNHLPSDYEGINMGMWGYSTDQELLVFKENALKYQPDIVIFSMFLDDLYCTRLYSVNDGIYMKPRFGFAPNEGLKLLNVPVPNNHGRSFLLNLVLTRFYELRNRLEMGSEFYRRGWFSIFDRTFVQEQGYYLPLRLLGEAYALADTHKCKFLLVIIPWKDQLKEDDIYAAGTGYAGIPPERLDFRLPQNIVRRFCEELGVPVLDLLPAFKRQKAPETLFFKRDCHWTRAGHRLAAKEILDHLKQLGYL